VYVMGGRGTTSVLPALVGHQIYFNCLYSYHGNGWTRDGGHPPGNAGGHNE